ncbi:MAG: sun, partial [Halothiobacillaceae bacterium]
MRAREAAAWVITSVVVDGRSLSAALPHYIERLSDPRERALLQELCYGVLRWWPRLQALAERLLHKPLKQKESDIQALLLIGIYQLLYMRVAEHAAVTETVNAVKALNKPWAAALLNAALRRLLRDKTALLA